MKQLREKSLTTHAFRLYRISILVFIVLLAVIYMLLGYNSGGIVGMIILGVIVVFALSKSYKDTYGKIKEISYDEENLYVHEQDYEIQIPYHQVKDVEIISLGGLYKFTLLRHDQFGREVICKPSIWYPLNYRKIDKKLNKIRSMIRKAQWKYKDQILTEKSLASIN